MKVVCNYKQAYTQYGGLRPFGVAFLFAGWDKHYGFQLYQVSYGILKFLRSVRIGTCSCNLAVGITEMIVLSSKLL